MRQLLCVSTILSAFSMLTHKSSLTTLWGTDEESEMQEGRVICPRLHTLINVKLPFGGQLYSSNPDVLLNYSHFPFFLPGLIFGSYWYSGSW